MTALCSARGARLLMLWWQLIARRLPRTAELCDAQSSDATRRLLQLSLQRAPAKPPAQRPTASIWGVKGCGFREQAGRPRLARRAPCRIRREDSLRPGPNIA